MDPALKLNDQVMTAVRSTFGQLWIVCPMCPVLDWANLAMVIYVLVSRNQDHCSPVALPVKSAQKLQLVQNEAIRLLTSTRGHYPAMPLLYRLHWLPVYFRAQVKALILITWGLNGQEALF